MLQGARFDSAALRWTVPPIRCDGMSDLPDNPAGGGDVMLRISHYALLSGLCQFIPVPFADDAADRQVRKRLVGNLLVQRGRSFDVDRVKPLYAGPSKGIVGSTFSIAKGLILKPVKKLLRTVFFVVTIRRAILETANALLLGHTLDRLMADGWFADDASQDELRSQASRVERAVAAATASPERRGLTTLIRATARRYWPGRQADEVVPGTDGRAVDPEAALSDAGRERLGKAAKDLDGQLDSGEGQSALSQLDAVVDRHLGAIRQTAAT